MSCAMTSHCVHRIGLVLREVGVSSWLALGEEKRNYGNAGTISTRVLECCHYSMPQGGTVLLFFFLPSLLCILQSLSFYYTRRNKTNTARWKKV